MKVLLIVTVLGGGGPSNFPPSRLVDTTIVLRQNSQTVATSYNGRLEKRLARGTYQLESFGRFHPEGGEPETCESRTVHITRKSGRRSVSLYCSIA
jgi:hypothetical protein